MQRERRGVRSVHTRAGECRCCGKGACCCRRGGGGGEEVNGVKIELRRAGHKAGGGAGMARTLPHSTSSTMPPTQCPLCRGDVASLDPEVVVDMECSICHEDVTRAVPVRPCGHMFCSVCCDSMQLVNAPVAPARERWSPRARPGVPSVDVAAAEEHVAALRAHWVCAKDEASDAAGERAAAEERAAAAARPYEEEVSAWRAREETRTRDVLEARTQLKSAERWLERVRRRAATAAMLMRVRGAQ